MTDTQEAVLFRMIHLAVCDPGSTLPRGDYNGEPYGESVTHWSARAVLEAIRPFLAKPSASDRVPDVDGLTMAVQRAWDQEFTRPFTDGVDYRQARIAVETVLGHALTGKGGTDEH